MATQEVYLNQEKKNDCKKNLLSIGDGKIGRELFCLIKGRYRILYIRSPEELRVVNALELISQSEGYNIFSWDCSRGLLDVISMEKVALESNEINSDAEAVLHYIVNKAKADHESLSSKERKNQPTGGDIFILLDFHYYLEGYPPIERLLKEFVSHTSLCCIVIISPVYVCPPTLNKIVTLLDFPLPSRKEIKSVLGRMCENIPATKFKKALDALKENEEEILKSTTGLTIMEAENAYAKSLVQTKTFDIPTILYEKKQTIKKSGILEYRDSRFTFDQIGGLGALKSWLQLRKLAFKEDALKFGLDAPKGILLLGIPGTGKSCSADALAHLYKLPLLRLDVGALFQSHVGESEQNARMAIHMAESVSPTIFWIDEIEKGLGGVQSSNYTDGGVANRVFGTLLTWLQEKEEPVFVVATANNILGIPPEFMRAGRFDEIWFLDLPDKEQRKEVLSCLLLKKKRDPQDFDLDRIAAESEHYSPAELEKAINNALFIAYSEDKRQLKTEDIVSEIHNFQPLYNSRREEIQEMRTWALGEHGKGGRARLANASASVSPSHPLKSKTKELGRHIDLSENDL